MKKPFILIILLYATIMLHSQNVYALDGYMYEEKIVSYSRVNGETFRWEMTRELIIYDWEFGSHNFSGQNEPSVTIEMLGNTQRGQVENVVQPLYGANFDLTSKYHSNGELIEFNWFIYYFRDVNHPNTGFSNTMEQNMKNEIIEVGGLQYDVKSTVNFYSSNVQYYEYQNLTDDFTEIKVNTELSTKNYDDGRIEKSAVHMIKRLSDSTEIFEFDYEIQEKSVLQRYVNIFDQPYLWVPIRILGAFILVYIYIRIHRYITSNGIKIVKTHGKKIELVDEDPAEETQPEEPKNE